MLSSRFDPEMLDDDEYEAMTEGDRQAAEALMKRRDREEGREGRLRRGLLYDDDDDDEGMTKVKRRRAAEMAAMEVRDLQKNVGKVKNLSKRVDAVCTPCCGLKRNLDVIIGC